MWCLHSFLPTSVLLPNTSPFLPGLVDWKGLIREDWRTPMLVVKVFSGECCHVAWTDLDVVPDDWRDLRVHSGGGGRRCFRQPLDETD